MSPRDCPSVAHLAPAGWAETRNPWLQSSRWLSLRLSTLARDDPKHWLSMEDLKNSDTSFPPKVSHLFDLECTPAIKRFSSSLGDFLRTVRVESLPSWLAVLPYGKGRLTAGFFWRVCSFSHKYSLLGNTKIPEMPFIGETTPWGWKLFSYLEICNRGKGKLAHVWQEIKNKSWEINGSMRFCGSEAWVWGWLAWSLLASACTVTVGVVVGSAQ